MARLDRLSPESPDQQGWDRDGQPAAPSSGSTCAATVVTPVSAAAGSGHAALRIPEREGYPAELVEWAWDWLSRTDNSAAGDNVTAQSRFFTWHPLARGGRSHNPARDRAGPDVKRHIFA